MRCRFERAHELGPVLRHTTELRQLLEASLSCGARALNRTRVGTDLVFRPPLTCCEMRLRARDCVIRLTRVGTMLMLRPPLICREMRLRSMLRNTIVTRSGTIVYRISISVRIGMTTALHSIRCTVLCCSTCSRLLHIRCLLYVLRRSAGLSRCFSSERLCCMMHVVRIPGSSRRGGICRHLSSVVRINGRWETVALVHATLVQCMLINAPTRRHVCVLQLHRRLQTVIEDPLRTSWLHVRITEQQTDVGTPRRTLRFITTMHIDAAPLQLMPSGIGTELRTIGRRRHGRCRRHRIKCGVGLHDCRSDVYLSMNFKRHIFRQLSVRSRRRENLSGVSTV